MNLTHLIKNDFTCSHTMFFEGYKIKLCICITFFNPHKKRTYLPSCIKSIYFLNLFVWYLSNILLLKYFSKSLKHINQINPSVSIEATDMKNRLRIPMIPRYGISLMVLVPIRSYTDPGTRHGWDTVPI